MADLKRLQHAIAVLEAQRGTLGDAVVDAALAPLRQELAQIDWAPSGLAPQEERKHVTVLFADLANYTALAHERDPEEVNAILEAYFSAVAPIIARYGGATEKYIGDAVVALFGIPSAGENDAERAIRAALDMQQAVEDLNRALESAYGTRLSLRVGINSGPVLATVNAGRPWGDFGVVGDTVNIGARLERAAPPGGILISHATYREVRGVFDVQPQAPLSVKGKAQQIQTYVVGRARPRAFYNPTRGLEGVETRMVGRAAELGQLQAAFAAAHQHGGTQVVTIVGGAGVGKSRLLHEFSDWLALLPERLWYFRGRASPLMEGIAYSLLRAVLAERFKIQDSDPAAIVRARLESGLAEFFTHDSEMRAHFVGALAGYDFAESPHLSGVRNNPQQLRGRGLFYLGQLLTVATRLAPSLILLEDVHWADASSLDAVHQIARDHPRLRLLIVCLARPLLFERRPHWGQGLAHHTRLDVRPLSPPATRELVDEILQKSPGVPETLRELIASRAEGNPFYVEELVKVLMDDGVIVKDAETETWRVAANAAEPQALRVPPTLTTVLQARLDSLAPAEKTLLQQAAVAGRTFWDALLQALQPERARLDATLAALVHRELIYRRPASAFAGAREYMFKHALVRDVAYESVPRRERRAYHAQVAAWLAAATQASGRREEFTAVIAEHYALAGETDRAAGFLQQAAEHALSVSAFGVAQTLLERALELSGIPDAAQHTPPSQGSQPAPASDERRMALLKLLGDAGERLGDHAAASRHYGQSVALARRLGNSHAVARALFGAARVSWKLGDFAAARQHYTDALAQSLDDPDDRAEALHGLGIVTHLEGDYAAAEVYYQQALALREESGNRAGIAVSLNGLATIATLRDDYATAEDYYQQSLAIRRELGDRRGISGSLYNLGFVAETRGENAIAERYVQQSLALAREVGDPWGVAMCLGRLSRLYLKRDATQAARQTLHEGLRLAREIGAIPVLLYVLMAAAYMSLREGRAERAAELAGLVQDHPQTDGENRDEVARLRLLLTPVLPAPTLEAAMARGAALDLDAVVRAILAGGAGP